MLSILKTKVKSYDWCNQLGGWFTYAEIVLLVEHFGVKEVGTGWKYRYAVDHLKKGEECRVWFYFHPHKDFIFTETRHDTNILHNRVG